MFDAILELLRQIRYGLSSPLPYWSLLMHGQQRLGDRTVRDHSGSARMQLLIKSLQVSN
jgi:hypothetical protein